MNKMNSKRIEEFAVNAVRTALLRTDYLSPIINQGDKEPFLDGEILIYNNETQSKRDYVGRALVQIKGKEVSGIQKEEIKYSVKADDLRAHLKNGGVIYFVVHLTKNGDEKRIYYNALTPVKLRNILSTLGRKQSKSLKFKQLPTDSDSVVLLLLDFNRNSTKQSIIIDHEPLTIDDLKNSGLRTELTTTFYQKKSDGYGLAPDIFNRELYLYARTEKNGIFVPLDKEIQLEAIASTILKPISIQDEVFYSEYELSCTRDGAKITFGEMITMSMNNSTNTVKINIQAPELLKNRIIGARFLIATFEAGCFKIHEDIARLDVDTFDSSKINVEMLTQQLKYYERIQKMLDELNVAEDLNMTTLTREDSRAINYLVDVFIDKRIITEDEFENPGQLKITIQKIHLLLLVSKDKKCSTEYHIKHFLGKNIPFAQKLDDGRMQNVFPTFSILKKDEYAKLSNINFDIVVDMYEQCKENLDIYQIANADALEMLSAYDMCGKDVLLDSATKIFHWILFNDNTDTVSRDIKQLNHLQCIYRKRTLEENECEEIISITERQESSAIVKFAGYTLLEQFPLAKHYFSKLTSDEMSTILEYPICKIYKDLEGHGVS